MMGLHRGPDGPSTASEYPVTLYTNCSFQGISTHLTLGQYLLVSLTNAGFPGDAMSSIRVTPGYQAILYSQDNFGGRSLTVAENIT